MGMFGSRKQVAVSSVAYNMAGDENERPNYLKTTVFGSVMSDSLSLGRDIANSYLNGPAIKFRSFARWTKYTGYIDTIGQVSGSLAVGNSINNTQLREQIPHTASQTVQLQMVDMGDADFSYWADQWMMQNHYDQIRSEYVADMVGTTVTISFAGVPTYTFEIPSNFNINGRYIYASYLLGEDPVIGPLVPGTVIEGPWPSTSGWDLITDSTVNTDVDLTTEVEVDVTYSDGRPPEHSESETTRTETYQEIHREYMKDEFMGNRPGEDATYSIESSMYQDQVRDVTDSVVVVSEDVDIGGGIIKTTKTTTTTQNLGTKRSYRIDTQETTNAAWSNSMVFIYEKGTGNAILDAMFALPVGEQIFYPIIPFRVDSEFISPTNYPDIYEQSKKAIRKATTNGKYDKLVEQIADNESLEDIDYAYAVLGVSLNVKEVACREYIYRFFKAILDQEGTDGNGDYNAWKLEWNIADASLKAWDTWKTAQANPTDPLAGTPEPAKIPYPAMQTRQMKIRADGDSPLDYHVSIEWNAIVENEFVGVAKPGAKQGDLWFEIGTPDDFVESGYVGGVFGALSAMAVGSISLYWQDSNNTYRRLVIRGLSYYNFVYKGKHIIITADDALKDTEESGFIIPLHEGIYRAMPLKSSTQMATACMFLVFNCYEIHKKKWYQTGIFAVIIIIIIIVIAIFFPPAGAGAAGGGGLLGANAAVGAAIGLSGAAAVIVGAIANAIAAMLLVSLIQRGAVAIFGEKLGTIIGAIAAVIALNVGSAMAAGQTAAQGFAGLMQAQNLLMLTSTGIDAYAKYVAASTQELLGQTADVLDAYKVESEEISQAAASAFGTNKGVIDPLSFTDATQNPYFTPESADSFLGRTLLLGSDICDLSLEMLSNFASMTTSTKLET